MKKIKIIFDKNKKSLSIKKIIKKKLKKIKLKYNNLIIVIGGDGFMLKTLKKKFKQDNIFYGVNSGTYGFLMNKFSKKNIIKNLIQAKKTTISPLEMSVVTRNKKLKKALAINEISLYRQNKQACTIKIKINKKTLIKKLVGDGVIISTPAGSTAYNLSVHGPILNLDSKKISLIPISPFRPRRWKGKIINDNSKIIVKNLDNKKRPISAVADNYEIRNAKIIKVAIKKDVKFNILYNKNNSLQKKIKIEQLKKEIF